MVNPIQKRLEVPQFFYKKEKHKSVIPNNMKKAKMNNGFFIFVILFLFSGCSQVQNEDTTNRFKLPLTTGNEFLDIFMANGDSIITRPQHLGIVNSMASVGINHDYVGVLDGLWAIPLVG